MSVKNRILGLAFVVGTMLSGCAYGGIAMNAAGDKVAVARNDVFLFGLLRKVIICKASDQGVSNCSSSEAP